MADLQASADPGEHPPGPDRPPGRWHARTALRGLLGPARVAVRPLEQRLASGTLIARRTWRRSLQLRMMTITLLVSSLLVGAFGYLVVELTTRNLVERARSDVEQEIQRGAEYVRGQLSIHWQPGDRQLPVTMSSIVTDRAEGRRLVALIPPTSEGLH